MTTTQTTSVGVIPDHVVDQCKLPHDEPHDDCEFCAYRVTLRFCGHCGAELEDGKWETQPGALWKVETADGRTLDDDGRGLSKVLADTLAAAIPDAEAVPACDHEEGWIVDDFQRTVDRPRDTACVVCGCTPERRCHDHNGTACWIVRDKVCAMHQALLHPVSLERQAQA